MNVFSPSPCRSWFAAAVVAAAPLALSTNAAPPASVPAAAPAPAPAPVVLPDVTPLLADSAGRAEKLLARQELAAYRGWLKFLRFEAETAVARSGPTSEAATEKVKRLDEWTRRIADDPDTLGKLRGVQEWAYESPVDDSGQPFKIAIPTDYDPSRPAPLAVYMHGYSGNHLEHSVGMASRAGSFDVAVLGRGRGGGYRALSEADVLHVVDYIQAHWSIDADRIRLNGGSMGGGATFRLGSRYPHRWASGRPSCGFASFLPVPNLLTLPLYATHSDDDYTVPILLSRGPLARLRELGGVAILDETTGYGHAVWDYKAGNERGLAWENLQVRPDSRSVRHIDYTALDGAAVRGWWAEVAEWGNAPKPARFILTAAPHNTLMAELTNVTALRLRLAESPFNRSEPLSVVIGGAIPITLPAPLPDTAVLRRGDGRWAFESAPEAAPARLHTPGGASLLYAGDPLVIVYGTSGSEAERTALRAAAEAASKSPNPSWVDDAGEAGSDHVPHSQNLYGHLRIKADSDVTDADLARCHLVLIGTAKQNRVVARMADQLPVTVGGGAIACRDGVRFDGAHRVAGLVHFNPLAPTRLIFWVASEDPAAYRAGAGPTVLTSGTSMAGALCGGDLIITDATAPVLVATRSFDSRWAWTDARDSSPTLPPERATHGALAGALGEALRREFGADFAFVETRGPRDQPGIVPGLTRVSDLRSLYYFSPVGEIEVTGAELKEIADRVSPAPEVALVPALPAAGLEAARTYRVVLPAEQIWTFVRLTHRAPAHHRLLDRGVADAVDHWLLRSE